MCLILSSLVMRHGPIFMSPSGNLITGYVLWNMAKGQVLLNKHWQQRQCYTPCSSEILGRSCKSLFQKVGVYLELIRIWFWKQLQTNMRKVRPKASPSCPFVTWQCSGSPQILNCSTVFEVWKGQCIVAPSLQPRPGPARFLPLSKIEKNKQTNKQHQKTNKHQSGRQFRSQSALGSVVHQFLMGVSKDDYEVFQKLDKRLKRCLLAKGGYFDGYLTKELSTTIKYLRENVSLAKVFEHPSNTSHWVFVCWYSLHQSIILCSLI